MWHTCKHTSHDAPTPTSFRTYRVLQTCGTAHMTPLASHCWQILRDQSPHNQTLLSATALLSTFSSLCRHNVCLFLLPFFYFRTVYYSCRENVKNVCWLPSTNMHKCRINFTDFSHNLKLFVPPQHLIYFPAFYITREQYLIRPPRSEPKAMVWRTRYE